MTEGLMRMMNDEKLVEVIFEIKERLIKLETKIDLYNVNDYKDKTEEALTIAKDVDKRVCKIEDMNKWLWKTTVGSIITVVITALAVVFKITN